jgi:hypothetical protein
MYNTSIFYTESGEYTSKKSDKKTRREKEYGL